jgi:hypothetical protein
MVQFFNEFKTGAAKLADLLAPSLGQGLGSMFSSYQANKALESALNDPKLKSASIDEKLSALETKMRPFGSIGEQLFNRRFQLEQQAEERRRQKELELKAEQERALMREEKAKSEELRAGIETEKLGLKREELMQKLQSQKEAESFKRGIETEKLDLLRRKQALAETTAEKKFYDEQIKKEEAKLPEENQLARQAYDRQMELINKGNLGLTATLKKFIPGNETQKDVAEFEQYNAAMEKALSNVLYGGRPANREQFNFVKSFLVSPTDSEAVIKSKMNAIGNMLGFEQKMPGEIKYTQDQLKKIKLNPNEVLMSFKGELRAVPKERYEQALAEGYILP